MPGFGSIIGQEKALRFLTALLYQGTIPNALLFSGPEGVGKRAAALTFSKAANCSGNKRGLPATGKTDGQASAETAFPTEPCNDCRSCGKIDSGAHPDVIPVNPIGRVTKISQIRELRQVLAMKPFEARLRVVVAGEAHTMNAEAANALLKVLEEPPDRTLLILITIQTSDLLPTIVSRCQHIRFRPVSRKILAEALINRRNIEPEQAKVLASLAGGSFSKAIELNDTDCILRRNWLIEEAAAIDSNPTGLVLALAEKLSKNLDDALEALDIFKIWFRDLIVAKYLPDRVVNADHAQKVFKASQKRTVNELLDHITAVQKTRQSLDSNANPRLALENLFLFLAESSRNN